MPAMKGTGLPDLPKVTEGQVVAAMLRGIASQLVRLAEKLDAEVAAARPVKKSRGKVETAMELVKRLSKQEGGSRR